MRKLLTFRIRQTLLLMRFCGFQVGLVKLADAFNGFLWAHHWNAVKKYILFYKLIEIPPEKKKKYI